jgi:O-antigen/teichoic acid export membrane protein
LSETLTLLTAFVLAIAAIAFLAIRTVVPIWSPTLRDLLSDGVIVFALTIMFSACSAILRSTRRVTTYGILQLTQSYLSIALGLILVLGLRTGVRGLLWGTSVVLLGSLLVGWLLLGQYHRIRLRLPTRAAASTMLSYSLFTSAGSLVIWVLNLSDRWLVGIFRGSAEAGIYSVSYDLAGKTLYVGITALGVTLMPLVSTVWERSGRTAVEAFLPKVMRFYLILMLPATVGLSVLSETLLKVMAPAKYDTGFAIVPLVAAGTFCYGIGWIYGRCYPLAERPDLESRNYLIGGLVNLGLNLAFIPVWGYRAAAVSTFLAFVLMLVIQTIGSRRYLRWRFPAGVLGRCALASAAMAGILIASGPLLLGAPAVVQLVGEIALGGAAYLVGLVALGELAPTELRRAIRR